MDAGSIFEHEDCGVGERSRESAGGLEHKDCGVGEASRESAAGCGRGTCRGEPAVRTWNWFE